MTDDLVVVLPGIMGSTLSIRRKPVWGASSGAVLRAIQTLGGSLKELRLPDGIGDDHPGDGVEPAELMPDLHVIPGIWTPVTGYSRLLDRLRNLGYREETGNLLPVPYDWRLSNRFNGRRLAGIVEPALDAWRSRRGTDARIVFVCHSMGGLVARWYIEKCGGADLTRKLITLGTPYRGAAKAVEQLVNGVRKGIGPLSVDLTEFARSMPSLHQLLPEYACVDRAGTLLNLTETALPELDSTMVADAMTFHRELRGAEAVRPESLTMTHAIVGVRQPTCTTVRISGNAVEPLDTIDGDNDFGDGTVPLPGAIGHGLTLDTNAARRIVDQHGHIQANRSALDELEEVITTRPVLRRAGEPVPVRVSAPDLILTNERLPIQVEVDADVRDSITIAVVSETGNTEYSRRPSVQDGRIDVGVSDLPPGGYEIRVTGTHPGSLITPATSPVLVWDPALGGLS